MGRKKSLVESGGSEACESTFFESILEKIPGPKVSLPILLVMIFIHATLRRDTPIPLNNVPAICNSLGSDIPGLLEKKDLNIKVDRADIPQYLSRLIEGCGVVASKPRNHDYDPINKQNLYIIADAHVGSVAGVTDKDSMQAKTQIDSVKIFHVLMQLGVKKQMLEGFPNEGSINHNTGLAPFAPGTPDQLMALAPQMGAIISAGIANESNYKDSVQTVGLERSTQQLLAQQKDMLAINAQTNAVRTKALQLLTLHVAQYFKVDQSVAHFQYLLHGIQQLNLSDDQLTDVLSSLLKKNPLFQAYAQAKAKMYMKTISSDNKIWAKNINNEAQDNKDTVVVAGMAHLRTLIPQIDRNKWNVFVIIPQALQGSELGDFARTVRSEDDFIAEYLKSDIDAFIKLVRSAQWPPVQPPSQ